MTLKELQKEVSKLYDEYNLRRSGKKESRETLFIHLVEEVGELARQYVNKDIRPAKYDEKEVADAIADIVISTLHLGVELGVDAESEIKKVMDLDQKFLNST